MEFIDTSHPEVRDYLSLIRLQVLTPLSLLINIATVSVCATVAKPTIGGVSRLYPTSISPNPTLIAMYIIAIWAGQIGYCVLLVIARKAETKKTLVRGVGFALVFSNWLMATWAIAWVLEYFILASILQGLLLACLLYSNTALLIEHPPTSSRPFDTALIHAPLRLFLILPLSVLFPYALFVSLGLTYANGKDYASHPWPGFGVVIGTNILGTLVIITRRDVVWCVAAIWICISILVERPKPMPVYITEILFVVLHPISLMVSLTHAWYHQEGRIALSPDGEEPSSSGHERTGGGAHHRENHRPREVDAGEVWA